MAEIGSKIKAKNNRGEGNNGGGEEHFDLVNPIK
jgi:hypothetical protein